MRRNDASTNIGKPGTQKIKHMLLIYLVVSLFFAWNLTIDFNNTIGIAKKEGFIGLAFVFVTFLILWPLALIRWLWNAIFKHSPKP